MGYSIGVDLGTSCVRAARTTGSGVELIPLAGRSAALLSVVALSEDGQLLVGAAAAARAADSPGRVAGGFKRHLGAPSPVLLGGEAFSVIQLLAALLRDVLAQVTEAQGEPPEQVVLTHPSTWGPLRRAKFEELPQLAGLRSARFLSEAEAAARHFAANRSVDDGDVVAVCDLGGAHVEATVLRKRPDGFEIVGAPAGVELGGLDFDRALLDFVDAHLGGAVHALDPDSPGGATALARLRQECVLAKETLSEEVETTIPVFLPGRYDDVPLTRGDFEHLILASVEPVVVALDNSVSSAQLKPGELTAVLVVGGCSRIPLVSRLVARAAGRAPAPGVHPERSVALGAAALASTRCI
jgi:molecular chaperone DnaK (HSP70)